MVNKTKVLVIGGGFGGLAAAKQLRSADVEVTLIDRRNHHLFQPLLYQVATGVLSPANIASPLRGILRTQINCRVLLAEVIGFDLAGKQVLLNEDERMDYDYMIVASGATHGYFGHDDWAEFAPGLKTLDEATEIRKRILYAFEAAERESDPVRRQAWLTFVIVGGGPTGVEMAGALSDIAHFTLKHDFRAMDPSAARILLIEASEYPLDMFGGDLPAKSLDALRRLQVDVRTKTKAVDFKAGFVVLESNGVRETISAETVVWAAGVRASPLAGMLAQQIGTTTDRSGRLPVESDLSLPGHPQVMVIGDMASVTQDNKPLPGLAPVAMQQGKYAATRIVDHLRGKRSAAFKYKDHGWMAVIGRYQAVVQIGERKFFGFFAWILWLVIHIVEITQFRNRILVFIQWGWTFFTRDRAARLIVGELRGTEKG